LYLNTFVLVSLGDLWRSRLMINVLMNIHKKYILTARGHIPIIVVNT